MPMIICPNKACGAEIPDDSAFCEECGSDIYRCLGPIPHFSIDADPYCAECGAEMVSNGNAPATVAPAPVSAPMQNNTVSQNTGTEIFDAPAARIFFSHSDGWNIELVDGDILGRTTGNHIGHFGSIKVISGTHAKITRAHDGWYIADQKSTNKTWVNGVEAVPFQPMKIKQGDEVILANVKFTVREV